VRERESDRNSLAQITENGALQYGVDSFVFRGAGKKGSVGMIAFN
jgi:hypothetical protein